MIRENLVRREFSPLKVYCRRTFRVRQIDGDSLKVLSLGQVRLELTLMKIVFCIIGILILHQYVTLQTERGYRSTLNSFLNL